jgi:hypothetical protein
VRASIAELRVPLVFIATCGVTLRPRIAPLARVCRAFLRMCVEIAQQKSTTAR